MEHKTVSLADQVFERLESDILSGKYAKGDVLTELKLSETLGVSRTPVREALRRLLDEHLIEEGSKGYVVRGVGKNDLIDIYNIRMKIEGMAAVYAANNITEEQAAELIETVDLQDFYANKKDPHKIREMDSRFHELLYRASGSTVLFDTLMPLHKKVQKFRKISVQSNSRANRSVVEHRTILEAVLAHDGDRAGLLMIEHVENALQHILEEQE